MAEQIVSTMQWNILIGASFADTITWKDELGALVPLPPGTTVEVKVRSTLNDEDVLAQFSTSPGLLDGLIVLTDPGVATLTMTATQTGVLQPISGAVFDIKYTFADGRVVVKLDQGKGRCNIRMVVTRP